ncbi:MAG TPA: response regulator transcription factor, partial [Rhodopila sp.]
DAIVLDRMLPGGLDGLGVLSTLRAAGVDAPVLILSALSGVDERVRGLRAGKLEMDLLTHAVRYSGKPIELLPREFRLLEFLMRHADQVVTRTMLFEEVWNYRSVEPTNLIDMHISKLRRKLETESTEPMIRTVRGAGYMLHAAG